MEAIEFAAEVQNGVIRIPEKYREILKDKVRVIVFTDKISRKKSDMTQKKRKQNFSDFLNDSIKISDFTMPSRDEKNQR